jgi:hypothetical protein
MHNEIKYFHWGPLLIKFDISKEFYNFLSNVVNESERTQYEFYHSIIKLNKEYEFSEENKHTFMNNYFSPMLNKYCDVYFNHWVKDSNSIIKGFYLDQAWINWQGPGEFRSLHDHNGDLSFVIYYDIPSEVIQEAETESISSIKPGSIIFRSDLNDSDKFFKRINSLEILPSTRECFIFPADLYHYTIPFKSNCYRISISGNIKVIK